VPVREDEPVPVGPLRIARVMAHDTRVEDMRQGSERHGGARMAAVGSLGGVHRKTPHDIDTKLFEFGIGHGCHTTRRRARTGSTNREVSSL